MTDAYDVRFPEYFDIEAPVIQAKGYFSHVTIAAGGRVYRPRFYDLGRFAQEIAEALTRDGFFHEPNTVVVPSLTREHIDEAIRRLGVNGFAQLTPE